jgi:hypothetical protein
VEGAAVNNQIALALNQRLEKVERTCEWLVEYCSTLESALTAALPVCVLGAAGPSFTPAHLAICRRCRALAELEELEDSPLPDNGDEGTGDE